MANHYPTLYHELSLAVNAACPEITGWRKEQNIERLDWEDMVRQHSLVLPYVIIVPESFNEWQEGPSDICMMQGSIAIIYAAANDKTDMVTKIDDRLSAIETQLLSMDFHTITVMPGMSRDLGYMSEANRAILNQKLPNTAGTTNFICLVPGANAV